MTSTGTMNGLPDRDILMVIMACQSGLCGLEQLREAGGLTENRSEEDWDRACEADLGLDPLDMELLERLVDRLLARPAAQQQAWWDALPRELQIGAGLSAGGLDTLVNSRPGESRTKPPGEPVVSGLHDTVDGMSFGDGLVVDHDPVGTDSSNSGPIIVEDRYEVVGLHARGGVGSVWRVFDRELQREVALKRLRSGHCSSADQVHQFYEEARITGQLDHPGVIPVYDILQSRSGQPCYTMRLVSGRTLTTAISDYHATRSSDSRNYSFAGLLSAFITVCNTIAFAHSRGVVHRDLKGGNVLLGDFGEVVVLDWGLARKLVDNVADQGGRSTDIVPLESGDDPRRTVEGDAVGTPSYMAPEQARGRFDRIDERTDVYGLGAILYELLTGRPPYEAATAAEVLKMVCEERPTRPCLLTDDVPLPLENICMKALAREPEDRYQSARELACEIEAWQDQSRTVAEEALRESQRLYQSLVENLPVGVWQKDQRGRYLYGNHRLIRDLGIEPEKLVGQSDNTLLTSAESSRRSAQDDNWVMATGQTLETTERRPMPDGSTQHLRIVRSPVKDSNGAVVGTIGVYWEMTERRRPEDLP